MSNKIFDAIFTTRERPYSSGNTEYINNKLKSIPELLRSVILANIIEESGGDPLSRSTNGYQGLLLWEPKRYTITSTNPKEELDKQIDYILLTYKNTTDKVSWTHGGDGTGYSEGILTYNEFINGKSLDNVLKAFTLGYVRPRDKHDSASNRLKVASQVFDRIRKGSKYNPILLSEVKVQGSLPWYRDLVNYFTNAMLSTAVAENPAVATASGWSINSKTGKVSLHNPTKEERQLGNNLAVISTFSPTNPGTAFVEKVLLPGIIKSGRIVSKVPKLLKGKPKFKSELDWSENWLKLRENLQYDAEDIAALKAHIPEYLEIERAAKANGTWLQMPDGSTWKGDPRSWVLLMSKDGLKLSKLVLWHGDDIRYVTSSKKDVTPIVNGKRILWASSEPHIARSYTNSDARVFPIALRLGQQPYKQIDAEGRIWKAAYKKDGKYYDTNTFSLENLRDGEYLVINNVIDKGSDFISKNSKYFIPAKPNESYTDYLIRTLKGNDFIIGKNTIRKYLVGNNGNFDLSNPNVYKALTPLISIPYVSSEHNN